MHYIFFGLSVFCFVMSARSLVRAGRDREVPQTEEVRAMNSMKSTQLADFGIIREAAHNAVIGLCRAGLSGEAARQIVRVELGYMAEERAFATIGREHGYLIHEALAAGRRAMKIDGVTWYLVGNCGDGILWEVIAPEKVRLAYA